jgi:hypothetical protein
MAQDRKPDTARGELAFYVAIVLGIALGLFIKRIRIGLVIGLILGLLIVFSGLLRNNRR